MKEPVASPTWLIEQGTTFGGAEHPLREMFADLLDELDEEPRRLLEAYFYERLTLSEIAQEFGWGSRKLAEYHVIRARGQLEALLVGRGIGQPTCSGGSYGRCTLEIHAKGKCRKHYDQDRRRKSWT